MMPYREIEAAVTIRRPVAEVFRFYRDFKNLPRFLGDVMAVDVLGPGTARWRIQGPLGIPVRWTTRVTEERADALIRYQTVTLPWLRTRWEIRFAALAGGAETEVREVMRAPLGRLGRATLAAIGRPPNEEIRANLQRLKELLETGRVTDTRHAVPGKFGLKRA